MQMTVVWIRDAGNGGAGPDSDIGGGTAMEVAAHSGASGISPAPCGPAVVAPGSLRTVEGSVHLCMRALETELADGGAVCLSLLERLERGAYIPGRYASGR
jgi:hypothetical protein